jgi:hypothetical protein
MALLSVQHEVQDYPAWRAVFDALDEVQRDWGVTDSSVHQLAGAPETVLVLHRFATVAQAQGFLSSRELKDAMERAGVQGTPRVEIYA